MTKFWQMNYVVPERKLNSGTQQNYVTCEYPLETVIKKVDRYITGMIDTKHREDQVKPINQEEEEQQLTFQNEYFIFYNICRISTRRSK